MQQARLKVLEKMVFDACARLKKAEAENQSLKLQVKGLARELERMQGAASELRAMRDRRDDVRARIRKLSVKIEKAMGRASQ
jgi:muconolactone delta-isomerase